MCAASATRTAGIANTATLKPVNVGPAWERKSAIGGTYRSTGLARREAFGPGTSARSVPLPAGAEEDAIKASYDKGILTVSVPLKELEAPEKRVSIESAD